MTPPTITQDQVQQHDGEHCPFCGSDEVVEYGFETVNGGREGLRELACDDCDEEYWEVFKLYGLAEDANEEKWTVRTLEPGAIQYADGLGFDALNLIAAERHRQVAEEGWTPKHGDLHRGGEMAMAAASYALPDQHRGCCDPDAPLHWPWDAEWWKPSPDDRIRELVKAGALIAAEIDRLQRLKAQAK